MFRLFMATACFSSPALYVHSVCRSISFLYCYEKVLETLIEDVLASGVCFRICIVNVNLV
jgi:hypothetical protein